MRPFTFERAQTVAEALELTDDDSAFLAGGTNLVDHMRLGIRSPGRVIDINGLGLDEITELPNGGLSVGALVRNADMATHPLVRTRYPFVTQALVAGASGQLRNMATTAGNLMQRTRCVYFQDPTTPCNKRSPGSGCSAAAGFGRYNALIGASAHCVAVHPSDLCIPLAALDAVVVAVGASGERRIPFGEFHRLPGDTPHIDTNLGDGELITAIELPPLAFATRSHYRKVRDRASYAFALVSVAAALEISDGTIRDVRLALGGVSHRPYRAVTAETELRGKQASPETFRMAAEAELEATNPGAHNAYKVPQIRNTITAVLTELSHGVAQ